MVGNIVRQFYLDIVIWLILLLLPFISYLYNPDKIADFDPYFALAHLANMLVLATNFYLYIHLLAPRYFFNRRKTFGVLIVIGLLLYILFNFLTIYYNPTDEMAKMNRENMFFLRVIVGPTIVYSLCLITASMVFLYGEQARQKELNKQIKLEKTTAELDMLKLQISPHFLFNTLNNIRWLIRKQADESENSIVKLSEILRYIIYEVNSPMVEFRKEVQHIQNFIDLQTLRLPVPGTIVLQVDDNIKNYSVHPLLFIHFVENAFKYGVDSVTAPDIQFQFLASAEGIVFTACNKILSPAPSHPYEGIGLSNVRRRLQLLYPNKHSLTIEQDKSYFNVSITICIDENEMYTGR